METCFYSLWKPALLLSVLPGNYSAVKGLKFSKVLVNTMLNKNVKITFAPSEFYIQEI